MLKNFLRYLMTGSSWAGRGEALALSAAELEAEQLTEVVDVGLSSVLVARRALEEDLLGVAPLEEVAVDTVDEVVDHFERGGGR